jgi:hypothetical protein
VPRRPGPRHARAQMHPGVSQTWEAGDLLILKYSKQTEDVPGMLSLMSQWPNRRNNELRALDPLPFAPPAMPAGKHGRLRAAVAAFELGRGLAGRKASTGCQLVGRPLIHSAA